MRRSRLAPALLCVLVAGCAIPQPPRPRPEKVVIPYARVAVVEFADRSPYLGVGAQFTEALREKLAERTSGTDVVVVPRAAVFGEEDPFVSGRISVDSLMRVRHDYLADAMLVGAVDDHNPYRPPSIHLSLKVVETAQGSVPFEVADGWDADDLHVRRDVDDYYRNHIGSDDCRFGPDIFLISPRYYMRFVADQVAGSITKRLAALP
jgi:hypothetical protein